MVGIYNSISNNTVLEMWSGYLGSSHYNNKNSTRRRTTGKQEAKIINHINLLFLKNFLRF